MKYADVPAGITIGYGTIELEVVSNDELKAKSKPVSYAGLHWIRINAHISTDA